MEVPLVIIHFMDWDFPVSKTIHSEWYPSWNPEVDAQGKTGRYGM